MKRTDLISQNNGRENPTFCPVGCPVCRYDGGLYPARFHRAELERETDLGGMERKANHIVFLLEGTLHIHIEGNEHHYLNSGQCMFLPRTQYPDIRAIAPSRVVWLDFSNRIVLGGQDALASTVLSGIHPAEGIPILSVTPQIERLLTEVQALEIPCYHMLKQYELFFLMKAFYADGELGCFFNAVLRPIHDFRAFVESNYANDDTLEDIARKTNLSKSYFIKRFKESFGVSVHQWLVKQKEEQLKKMLAAGKYDTEEMARLLGLRSRKGLYQFCRQRFRCSMTELKERLTDTGTTDEDSGRKDNIYTKKNDFNTPPYFEATVKNS